MRHLAIRHPETRMGLLAFDHDRIISWYLFAPPGPKSLRSPPTDTYFAALGELKASYDQTPNTKYFVVPGEQHVLLGGYGLQLPDGGFTAPIAGPDGGMDLGTWMNAWATGSPDWKSLR
jgi:hypothetical protein